MNALLPQRAQIVERRVEAENIITLRLQFCSREQRDSYRFSPGQFNMLYVFGVGEVPISIVSDPDDPETLDHTIRLVGPVTNALGKLKKREIIGLRGPFGSAWPLQEAQGKEIVILTGGLGCAPTLSALHYILRRRKNYGAIKIIHGIKAPADLIYQEKFKEWGKSPDTQIYLTVDKPNRHWKHKVGLVTNLLKKVKFKDACLVMMCGPEIMMRFAIKEFLSRGVRAKGIYLSMERNMKCAVGFCGHCQFGPRFICKDGPVLRYDRIQEFFNIKEL